YRFACSSTGDIWVGRRRWYNYDDLIGGGVTRLRGTDFAVVAEYSASDGLGSNDLASVYADASGAIWFGTAAGVSRFSENEAIWSRFTMTGSDPIDGVDELFEDRDGVLWAGVRH